MHIETLTETAFASKIGVTRTTAPTSMANVTASAQTDALVHLLKIVGSADSTQVV